MAWPEFLQVERVPFWRLQVKEHIKFLSTLDIDRVPDSTSARFELAGRKLPAVVSEWNAELAAFEVQQCLALHAATNLHLFELGWKSSEEPSDETRRTLSRGRAPGCRRG